MSVKALAMIEAFPCSSSRPIHTSCAAPAALSVCTCGQRLEMADCMRQD